MPTSSRRIPSLDGLRAISIALVLTSHAIQALGQPVLARYTIGVVDLGNLGVRVFFVISGFLITTLLMAEHSAHGTISLPNFYLRRTLRIFPPYYALIVWVAFATAFGHLALNRGDLLHALTYTMNYHPDRAWALGHTWSLAVEEQFYLLWPALLLVLGIRRGLSLAAAFVLLAPAIRIALLAGTSKTFLLHQAVGNSFETIGDAIAVGCVLAGFRARLWNNTVYRSLLQSRGFILVPVLTASLAGLPQTANTFLPRGSHDGLLAFSQTAGLLLTNVGIGLVIDWSVRNSSGLLGRCLNARIPVWIGTVSYSLYLWQQVFLNKDFRGQAVEVPVKLMLVFGVASLSYYFIERPSLRLRSTIERRWARSDLQPAGQIGSTQQLS